YTNPISTSIVSYIYLHIIKRLPFIWRYLYDNPEFIKKTERTKAIIHRINAPKLKAILDDFRPGVIACSQAYPCGIVADIKKMYNLEIPLVAILTDYVPHSYWIYDTVDYYIVPSEDIKIRLIEKGVEPSRIKSLGIPIDPKFNMPLDRKKIKLSLGLNLETPVILIMGGSHGLGPLKQILHHLDKSKLKFQEIVVTGINKRLFNYFKKRLGKYKKEIKLFGYANNVNELMAVSDIIITKPGGVTISEAMAMGLPMIIMRPIPGQEENNTLYLTKQKAAIKVDEPKKIKEAVEDLLSQPDKLKQLSSAARKMSNPAASMNIAKLLLELCVHN
ncbi:MAG: glycosyltransferase, partial [Candidatus Omnitrophica bacterium]|nr:glycosyltransferase [Candidatus Omnitrophota bacterium]